ncbi:MAG TPA: TonB-dependent receptor [Thermoanaerobaculia bacterium]|nr:TonB-dependent receptor [Thermoanaerobaculia bacterium]
MKILWRFSLLLLLPATLLAQTTTGTILGRVTTDGKALPGVTVTVASSALQGTRTTVSGEAGGYNFSNLPPDDYTATFELAGMQSVRKRVSVNVSTTSRADVDLKVSSVSEAITVTAAAAPTAESTQVTTNFKIDTINELPINRTINQITLLSPGVTDAGPNGQITISGSHSFDSIFLVDGVVVNENLRGQPNPLYIEDAIQETTVLTGGVSAEFGRFTGGVVSTITKSGGNEFSGSLRDNLTNPSWTRKSDFVGQVTPLDNLNHQYEGTLGGRIVRDRLWFFTAGRYQKTDTLRQTTFTNIPFHSSDVDRRYEAKLTGQITPRHSIVGSYTDEHDKIDNSISNGRVMDLRSIVPFDRPRSLVSLNYNGILSQNLLLEGQFSRMRDRFTNGAENRTLEQGTLLLDTSSGNRMWSATFCGSPCPAKQRNNKEYLAKGSYFLSTRAVGNHSVVGGYDEFHQLRNENNFQSGSDFRVHGIILCDKGGIAVACSSTTSSQLTSTNVYFGTDTSAGEIEYDPVPSLSKTSDFAVRSLFINDKWDLNQKWSFSVGGRYDKASGHDQAGHKTVDDSAMSPRLAANFDPKGNGRHRFSVSYGRYVSKVDQGPADNTATAGRYASYYWDYKGPVINAPGTAIGQLVPTDQVIKRVFDWFNSAGGTKAGPPLLTSAFIPGTTSRFDHSLHAPYMDEWTAGYGLTFGSRGYVRADYIHRKWAEFYSVRRTVTTGKAVDPNGNTFDQGVIENRTSGLSRRYHALQVQGNSRVLKAVTVGGNYTYAKLRGNVEGESPSFATGFTSPESYPEYIGFAQNNPIGSLGPDMRHRMNAWAQYDLPTPVGTFNFSLLQRYHSALSYSAVGTIDVRKGVANGPPDGVVNPGYATAPTNVNYYFSDRGAFRVDSISESDLGLNYYAPPIRGMRMFIETDFLNLFNQQGIENPASVDKTVLTRRQTTCLQTGTSTRCTAFNPFTQTPQQGVNWQKGPNFGTPTSAAAYQLPRTYRFSVGLKF